MKKYIILGLLSLTAIFGCEKPSFDTFLEDSSIEKVIPSITDDTIVFKNEKQFARFLKVNGLADYEVLAPTFDATIPLEDVVPYKWQMRKDGVSVYAIDPSYYRVTSSAEFAYISEPDYFGKQGVLIFDHPGLAKSDREFRTTYCPDVQYDNVDMYITNPYSTQTIVFKNVLRWSDRNGENIFNVNLKIWLVWGNDLPTTGTVSFIIKLIDKETECDISYRDYVPGHETAELRMGQMEDTYWYLRP